MLTSSATSPQREKVEKGLFKLYLRPDGSIVVPDLAESLIPLLRESGGDEVLWQERPCVVAAPILETCRGVQTDVPRSSLKGEPTARLWRTHTAAILNLETAATDCQPMGRASNAASLLDIKIELATRLLEPCLLCERRCGVNRFAGEVGFCGLTDALQVASYAMLYNEGPLVGAPTFAVFVRGCSLRCSFCYRPDELRAKGREAMPPTELAEILNHAADNGARSWHFLGGNPDESLPGVLCALAMTSRSLPIVWNSALMLAPEGIELLKGVVDIWLPDFKFGNDTCAQRIAGIDNYLTIIMRNLRTLTDQDHVVVRHMEMSGHYGCCTKPVRQFVEQSLPGIHLHTFPCHQARGS
jgi:putative pyruvate formate lyase activating enzyme